MKGDNDEAMEDDTPISYCIWGSNVYHSDAISSKRKCDISSPWDKGN